jgi:hypothetical protein
MANAGPRSNRRYKGERGHTPRWQYHHKGRTGVPEGEILVFSLDPLWVRLKRNQDCSRGEYVYAIKAEGSNHVKFGCSITPWSRLHNLQVGHPEELKLIFLISCGHDFAKTGVEKAVHFALGSSRVRGEWFDGWEPGVRRLTERPETLPWRVIEGMVGMGYKEWMKATEYPKLYRQHALNEKLYVVKRQFVAGGWGKV